MVDQQSDAERDGMRAVLKEILVELARQSAWNDHVASLRPRRNRKRLLTLTDGQTRWRSDNNDRKLREVDG